MREFKLVQSVVTNKRLLGVSGAEYGNKRVTSGGIWGSILWASSGRQSGAHLRASPPNGENTEIFVFGLPSALV